MTSSSYVALLLLVSQERCRNLLHNPVTFVTFVRKLR